jgi:transcriptional regulator with XRE-family HTH domain
MSKRSTSDQNDEEPFAKLRARFGTSVREQRLKAGWTQGELSRRTGIAQEELSRIENGQLNITLKTMGRLAEVLDGDVGDMLGRASATRDVKKSV